MGIELTIVPFYSTIEEEPLEKVAEIMKRELTRYNQVTISNHVSSIEDEYSEIFTKNGPEFFRDMDGFMTVKVSGSPALFDYITAHYSTHALVFSDYPLVGLLKEIDAACSKDAPIAFVNIKRFRDDDSGTFIKRISALGLHELGHENGLQHHSTMVDNQFCPMFSPNLLAKPETWRKLEYVDSIGTVYCPKCKAEVGSSAL